jgi:hypothetical protein
VTDCRDRWVFGLEVWLTPARLVAALEVVERFETHQAAADWYHARALPLPSNCMIRENPPLGPEHTAEPQKDLREWDLAYWKRTRRTGVFLACQAHRLELHDPPMVTKSDLVAIFGKVPATRNPPGITETQFNGLVSLFARNVSGLTCHSLHARDRLAR